MTWPAGSLAHRLRARHADLRRGVAALATLGLLTAMLTAVSAVVHAPAAQAVKAAASRQEAAGFLLPEDVDRAVAENVGLYDRIVARDAKNPGCDYLLAH